MGGGPLLNPRQSWALELNFPTIRGQATRQLTHSLALGARIRCLEGAIRRATWLVLKPPKLSWTLGVPAVACRAL